MSNRKQIYFIFSIKNLLIVLLIISLIIPVFVGNLKNKTIYDDQPSESALSSSEFTKDNYSAILTEDDHGLGSVSVDDMHFPLHPWGIVNHTEFYPLLDNDWSSGALTMEEPKIDFIETIKPAINDNINGTNIITITVKLNESMSVSYNNSQEGYLIYFPRFSRAKLLEFYVNDGNSIIKLTEGINYTIDETGFLVFYYEDYFQQGSIFNFKMDLIWEYDLALGDWTLDQREETPLIMRESEQEFTSRFTYQFFLIGWAVTSNLEESQPFDYINAALTIHPPDKDLLTYQDFIINGDDVNINNYVNPDKSISIELSDLFGLNRSFISLNFTFPFSLKFGESVGNSWAIDRLVAERNIRERIYFISISTGPTHVFLKNVALYDTGILIDEVLGANSLFNREVLFFDANASVPRQSGLKVNMPYLIFGETCPFTIKYLATQTLNIIVTDVIKMPLVGVTIEILLFGAMYGTYVSNKSIQPINPGITDVNGQVVLDDVPRGNYTVRVIWQGKVVKETTVTTDKEINYVFTSVPHFPLWILIFGMTSGIILAVGAILYLKNKKFR